MFRSLVHTRFVLPFVVIAACNNSDATKPHTKTQPSRSAAPRQAAVTPVVSDPEPAAEPSPPQQRATGAVLPPAQENARIRDALVASGKPHNDNNDRDAYDLAHRVVDDALATLSAKQGEIQLASFECFSGGCIATLKVAATIDAKAFEQRFQGYAYGAPTLTWHGGRAFPPAVVEDDRSRLYSVVFIRSDTPAMF